MVSFWHCTQNLLVSRNPCKCLFTSHSVHVWHCLPQILGWYCWQRGSMWFLMWSSLIIFMTSSHIYWRSPGRGSGFLATFKLLTWHMLSYEMTSFSSLLLFCAQMHQLAMSGSARTLVLNLQTYAKTAKLQNLVNNK